MCLSYVSRGTRSDEVVRLYWAVTKLDDHDWLLLHSFRDYWIETVASSCANRHNTIER